MRANRRAIVVVGTAIPGAVPAVRFDGAQHRQGMALVSGGALVIAARAGQRRKVLQGADQEPTEPDALALASTTDAVHAVVPIARAHLGQASRSGGRATLDGAH